jgi:hypothetical protein
MLVRVIRMGHSGSEFDRRCAAETACSCAGGDASDFLLPTSAASREHAIFRHRHVENHSVVLSGVRGPQLDGLKCVESGQSQLLREGR